MTGIHAAGTPVFVHQAVTGRRDAAATAGAGTDTDTRTFTAALLTADARAMSSPDAAVRIAGGTMRRAAEAFGAHGLFDGSVPAADAPGAEAEGVMPAATTSRDYGPDVVAAQVSPITALPEADAGGLATAASVVSAAPRSSAAGPLVHLIRGGPAMASLATIIGPEAPSPSAAAAVSSSLAGKAGTVIEAALDEARTTRLPPAAADGGAASRLAVSLDADERGIAVTVAGAIAPDEDHMVYQAVARLLARHGLVMSTLRIARYSSAERRHQGNR